MTEPTEQDVARIAALKWAGHSAAKAMEIDLDAKRGDPYAMGWAENVEQTYRAHLQKEPT